MKQLDLTQSLLVSFAPYQGKAFYLAFEKYESDLKTELELNSEAKILWIKGRLFLVEGLIKPALWAQSHWLHPFKETIDSIGAAAKLLRQQFPRWVMHSIHSHRRCQLIEEKLISVPTPIIEINKPWPRKSYGAWTLESPTTLWYSTQVLPELPLGLCAIKEDKLNPPSRAFGKLWELFTVHGIMPQKGQRVVDMGSCPGGWTWVLQQQGCHVISVDKAPLDPKVAVLPNVTSLKKDAFALRPDEIGPIDWFFSDIICYPEKLFELVQKWRESGLCSRFVCTIKFQGSTDFTTLQKFADIPHSKLIHLNANKHEVTWIY